MDCEIIIVSKRGCKVKTWAAQDVLTPAAFEWSDAWEQLLHKNNFFQGNYMTLCPLVHTKYKEFWTAKGNTNSVPGANFNREIYRTVGR